MSMPSSYAYTYMDKITDEKMQQCIALKRTYEPTPASQTGKGKTDYNRFVMGGAY